MSGVENRNIGLDLIRSVAIIMVLISHSRNILHYDSLVLGEGMWRLSVFGFYGVELFFVLSGFLIGRILIKKLTSEDVSNFANILLLLKKFWLRRWFRTIPLYILMLVMNYVLFSFSNGIESLKNIPLWRYLFFLQDYNIVSLGFFPESWSLTVEEWFYLIVPIILVIFLVMSIRIIYVLYVGDDNLMWDSDIRKNTFLRLDSLGTGVMFAYLFEKKNTIFDVFSSKKALIFGLCGIIVNMLIYVNDRAFVESLYAKTILFNIVTISWGAVMCYSYNMKIEQNFGGVIMFLSKISYAVYLVHLPIVAYVTEYTLNVHSMIYKGMLYCCTWLLVFIVSYFVHKYYEYPIMNLRDKL